MRTRATSLCAVAAGLLFCLSPCAAQEKDLAWAVSQAPADACLVATIRNVSEFETSLKALAGPDAEEMALVKSLGESLPPGVLDVGGPLVYIVPVSEKGFPGIAMLRLKDEASLNAQTVEGQILKVVPSPTEPGPPAGSPPVYVLKFWPWAALGNDLGAMKALALAPSRLALTDADRAALGGHLIWIQAHPQSLAAAARQAIGREQKRSEAGGEQIVPPALIKTLPCATGLLGQMQSIALAADVGPQRATARLDVALAEGSSLLAAAQAGLPVERFTGSLPAADGLVAAGWGRVDWARALPPMKALLRPFFDALTEGGDAAARKNVDELWASYERWAAVLGADAAVLLEAEPPGKGLFRFVETVTVKDPAEYRRLVARQMAASRDLLHAAMHGLFAMPGMPRMKTEVQFKEAAETIEGLPVDMVTVKVTAEARPDAPPGEAARAQAMLEAVYGPEGMVVRLACVDKLGLVVLGDAEAMARAVRTARGQGPGLGADPRVAAAIGRLPESACVTGIVSIGNYVHMLMTSMERTIAQAMPPEVKAAAAGLKPLDPPPLADLATFSLRLEGRSISMVFEVPQSEVRAAVAGGKQGSDRLMWYVRKQEELSRERTPAPPGAAKGKKD
jgi:hypothetical protein